MKEIEYKAQHKKICITLYPGKDNGVIFCPPHPLYGGSRYDLRLVKIAKKLSSNGIMVCALDYYEYTGGFGEIEDVFLCIDYLKVEKGIVRLGLLGYSYGAIIGSIVAMKTKLEGFVALSILKSSNGLTANLDFDSPKLLVHGTNDQIAPISEFWDLYSKIKGTKESLVLETDHFYTGNVMEKVSERVLNFFKKILVI